MKRQKRGQVAMEFLMTYGWAIIIILLAVAALWYLGVFKTSIVNRCEVKAPFNCGGVKIIDGGAGSDTVTISLGASTISSDAAENYVNKITANEVTCLKAAMSPGNMVTSPNDIRVKRVEFTCAPGDVGGVGDKFSGQIEIAYQEEGGLTHKILGTIGGEVESA